MTAPPETIAATIWEAATQLAEAGSETPRLDAEVLLRHLLGVDRTGLFLRLPEPLAESTRQAFAELVERRRAGEPVAYLTGAREFMGLPFAVGPGVLVPRPETEILVEWAVDWLASRSTMTVVDVGTGSGAIALAVASLSTGKGHRIIACDRSPDALRYAAENRERLGLNNVVDFVTGDLLTWCRVPVDLVLANLPYLRPEQRASNPALWAEPVEALVSGAAGLDAIERLIGDLPRLLAPGGAVAFELDPSQVKAVVSRLHSALPDVESTVLRDLAGLERVVVGQRR